MHKEIVSALLNEDEVMHALDYAQKHEVSGLKLKLLYDSVNAAKTQGDDIKAAMISKRITELKKVSLTASHFFYCRSMKARQSRVGIDPCWRSE